MTAQRGNYKPGHVVYIEGRLWIIESVAHTGASMVVTTIWNSQNPVPFERHAVTLK